MKIIRKNKVTVRVSEYNFESFINECKQNNIVLEDVTKEADGYILTMSFDSFRAIRPIVRKTRVRLRVKKKEGAFAPSFLKFRKSSKSPQGLPGKFR